MDLKDVKFLKNKEKPMIKFIKMHRQNLREEKEIEKFLGKIFYDRIVEVLNDINTCNGIIIDIGAGVGFFTTKFSEKAKKVIAIEPEPRNLNSLRKNVDKNRLKNVYIVGEAAWNCDKKLKLYVSNNRFAHSIVNIGKKAIEIQGDTLDNILSNLGVEKEIIELMKINVEGSELQVLLGAKKCLSRTKRVIIQTHYKRGGKGKTTKEVEQFLKTQDFSVHTKIFKGFSHDLVYGEKLI